MTRLPPGSTLFPYTTLFRSIDASAALALPGVKAILTADDLPALAAPPLPGVERVLASEPMNQGEPRSEEHTSELQSPYDLVCRLLLEKKKLAEATCPQSDEH